MTEAIPIAGAAINLPIAASVEERVANAASSWARGLPRFVDLPECQLGRFGRAALVSGGPSAVEHLETIRKFETVVACGSAHDWLVGHGIVPAYCVIFDPKDDHARFYKEPMRGVTYLVASTCHPSVFDALAQCEVRIWHPFDDLPHVLYNNEPRVGGGSTATLRAIALAHIMGLRELHMFGFDSCYMGGLEHAYPYVQDRPEAFQINYNGHTFMVTPQLLAQAHEFLSMYHDHQHEISCKIYGNGLIATMLRESSLVTLEPLDA